MGKIIVLGSGTSQGIPVIGCKCSVCMSTDKKDKRLRSSLYVECGGLKILIDIGPDFRQQMLSNELSDIDLILLTHEHSDHIAGIDDIRPINFKHHKSIPMYGLSRVIKDVRDRFAYVFDQNQYPGTPQIHTFEVMPFSSLQISAEIAIRALPVSHGNMEVLAYKFPNFAYVCDVSSINDKVLEELRDLPLIIMSALHHRHHHAHFNLQQALDMLKILNPKVAYLTHTSHEMGTYDEMMKELPPNVFSAYDGMTLEF